MIEKDKQYLESIIDRVGLSTFLEEVGDICYEKADHTQTALQNRELGVLWRKAALEIRDVALEVGIRFRRYFR